MNINIYISATQILKNQFYLFYLGENGLLIFFSAGMAKRNEEIAPTYFTRKFAKYSQNPQEMYSSITISGKLKTFRYHHLISSRKDDKKGSEKDDRTYILGDQYPFIRLSYPASADFADAIAPKKDTIRDMH